MKETYQLRTDFCDELVVKEHHDDTLSCVIKEEAHCKVTHVEVRAKENVLQKDVGHYITIEFESMHDQENRDQIITLIYEELFALFEQIDKPIEKVLVVGLGNREVVSDALGPKCCDQILVTSHLYADERFDLLDGTRNVAVLIPGVMGQTGLESAKIVESVTALFKPDVLLVVDALATSSIDRINHAVQISDTGIKPGSGVGNHRLELSERTLHIPVIAVGVATVTSIGTIIKEACTKLDKQEWVSEMNEVMDLSLIVTPKNMDDDLMYLVTILSEALNYAVHPEYEKL